MTEQSLNYRGFTIKVITHDLFPGKHPSQESLGWYATSVVISRNSHPQNFYHEKCLHPDRISVTHERARDYGWNFAKHVIDDEILYANLSMFLANRPI